jgi:hypothetical protein
MINKRPNEPRIDYLARVLYRLMHDTTAGEETIEYDGTSCDGMCLAQDIVDELGIDAEELL